MTFPSLHLLYITLFVALFALGPEAHGHTVFLDIDMGHKIPMHTDKNLAFTLSKSKGGTNFHVYFARVKERDKEHVLDDYGTWKLAKEASALVIRVDNKKDEEEIKLPELVARGLLDIFREAPTQTSCGSDFDCACFVHHAHGVILDDLIETSDQPGKVQLNPKTYDYWQISKFAKEDLVPGDVINLHNEKTREQHFAIYLGPNLYLSKFGASGIYATDMTALKQVYPYPNLEIWKPVTLASCAKKVMNSITGKHVIGACVAAACTLAIIFSDGR